MKIYSDNAITKDQVDALAAQVDEKQADQIKKLRLWVGASFVLNAALTIALFFVK